MVAALLVVGLVVAGMVGAEGVDPLKRDRSDLGFRMDAISLRNLTRND